MQGRKISKKWNATMVLQNTAMMDLNFVWNYNTSRPSQKINIPGTWMSRVYIWHIGPFPLVGGGLDHRLELCMRAVWGLMCPCVKQDDTSVFFHIPLFCKVYGHWEGCILSCTQSIVTLWNAMRFPLP